MTAHGNGSCCWPTGCTEPVKSGRYCGPHWQKLYRTGHLRSGFIDPTPTREHITEYINRGGTFLSLSKHARTACSTISEIYADTTKRIRVGVADRILAVPMRPSNVGCVRRLNALTALGHPMPIIATAGGSTADTFHAALQKARFVDAVAWQTVHAFNKLQGTPSHVACAKYVAACAKRRGAVPPLAWFGVDIDDPTSVPDIGEITRLTVDDRLAEIRHLTALGETTARACARVGWSLDTLKDHRGRRTPAGGEAA